MSNISVIPNNGLAPNNKSMASHLRELADWLDEPDSTPYKTIALVFEATDGEVHRQVIGKPCDLCRTIGLLMFAAQQGVLGKDNEP